jgi:hypothetical protein
MKFYVHCKIGVALKDDGARVRAYMGFNTSAKWQYTPEKEAVTG